MANSIYSQFAESFASASLETLVDNFNSEVGNHAWTSARAAFLRALVEELERRGIDLAAVRGDIGMSFAHHVALDDEHKRLVAID